MKQTIAARILAVVSLAPHAVQVAPSPAAMRMAITGIARWSATSGMPTPARCPEREFGLDDLRAEYVLRRFG
jgi:hypothetical protein